MEAGDPGGRSLRRLRKPSTPARSPVTVASAISAEAPAAISGLGADPTSDSPYVRARGIGEVPVKEAFPGATILRPSVIFGPRDAFFNRLTALARVMPVLPLFGSGTTRLQPVYVGDVAESVVTSAAEGKVYELGGRRFHSLLGRYWLACRIVPCPTTRSSS